MLTRIGAEWEERKMTEMRWEGRRIREDSQLERGDWGKNGGLGGQEEEENSWEETLATSLQILARAKAQLPGDFVVVRFDGTTTRRWWYDELAGTCSQFQWTGYYHKKTDPCWSKLSKLKKLKTGAEVTAITLDLKKNVSCDVKEANQCDSMLYWGIE